MDNEYQKGQEVVNPARSEWGVGTVLEVDVTPDGKARRVRVRFQGAGLKTLLIPPGKLARAGEQTTASPESDEVDAGRFVELPDIIFDRRADLKARLQALFEHYRVMNDSKAIFDWAVVKLGCKDPLSRFSADELVSHFEAFCRKRDWALKRLYQETVRAGLKEEFDALLDRLADSELRRRIRKRLR